MSQNAVIDLFGIPEKEKKSRSGLIELHYANACYRFDGNTKLLIEITADCSVVEFEVASLPFKRLAHYLKQQDPDLFEKVGFVVSPKFGVALDPDFSSWVTVFSKQQLLRWQAI